MFIQILAEPYVMRKQYATLPHLYEFLLINKNVCSNKHYVCVTTGTIKPLWFLIKCTKRNHMQLEACIPNMK